MKRNKPDNDDSTHGTKCSLDHGDLSEWEYLTHVYDQNELFDDHHVSTRSNEARQSLPHDHPNGLVPSNLSLQKSLKSDHSEMEQKNLLRHGFGDGCSSEPSELVLRSQLFQPDDDRRNSQNVAESALSRVAVSSDQQHWMINPAPHSDRCQRSTQNLYAEQQPKLLGSRLLEPSSEIIQKDESSAYDRFMAGSTLFDSDGHLADNESSSGSGNRINSQSSAVDTKYGEETHLSNHTPNRDQYIPDAKNTDIPMEQWFLNHDPYVTDTQKELPFERWNAQNKLEPISIHSDQETRQYLEWGHDGTSAAKEKMYEQVSEKHLNRTEILPVDTDLSGMGATEANTRSIVTETIDEKNHTADSMRYCETDVESFGKTVPRTSTVGIATCSTVDPQMAVSVNLQNQSVPPYQQMNNNSLLLKPLTPYNYFYRDERDNIVLQISDEHDPLPPPVSDFSIEKMQHLLKQHWYVDPVRAKRVHRKTHGKMSFQNLSKIISERWRILPTQGREFYRSVARSDEIYYNQHLINQLTNEGSSDTAQQAEAEEVETKSQFQSEDHVTATRNLPKLR